MQTKTIFILFLSLAACSSTTEGTGFSDSGSNSDLNRLADLFNEPDSGLTDADTTFESGAEVVDASKSSVDSSIDAKNSGQNPAIDSGVDSGPGMDSGSVCVPQSCANDGVTCGQLSDGCGGVSTCLYQCTAPDTCGAINPNRCGCSPLTQEEACLNVECGLGSNGCGGEHTCTTCSYQQVCQSNTCSGCIRDKTSSVCSSAQPFEWTCDVGFTPDECTNFGSTWCCLRNEAECKIDAVDPIGPSGPLCPVGKTTLFSCPSTAFWDMRAFNCVQTASLTMWCCPGEVG